MCSGKNIDLDNLYIENMNFAKLPLKRLLEIREKLILEGRDDQMDLLNKIIHQKELRGFLEDTSATGGPSGAVMGSSVGSTGVAYSNAGIGGMGSVVAPQPSIFAGSTGGSAYTTGGGSDGSGDVAFPFPALGGKYMYQKQPVPSREHGSKRAKKGKKGTIDLKKLRALFNKGKESSFGKPGGGKVMSFDEYEKDIMNRVKRSN
jgi:hypothetical protein